MCDFAMKPGITELEKEILDLAVTLITNRYPVLRNYLTDKNNVRRQYKTRMIQEICEMIDRMPITAIEKNEDDYVGDMIDDAKEEEQLRLNSMEDEKKTSMTDAMYTTVLNIEDVKTHTAASLGIDDLYFDPQQVEDLDDSHCSIRFSRFDGAEFLLLVVNYKFMMPYVKTYMEMVRNGSRLSCREVFNYLVTIYRTGSMIERK